MEVRRRIPLFDEIIDSCRMLPELLQVTLFLLVFGFASSLMLYGFKNLVTSIIVVESLFILMLVQKNIVYRRISKIDKAVKYKILWVKTRKEGEKKVRFLAYGIVFAFIGFLSYWNDQSERLFLVVILLSILFVLKAVFFVPTTFVRITEKESIQFVDESRGELLSFGGHEINRLEIQKEKLRLHTSEASMDFDLLFDKMEERNRLQYFLRKVLKEVEVE